MAGPILFSRGADAAQAGLVATVVLREADVPPVLRPDGGEPVEATCLVRLFGHAVWAYGFALPAREGAGYALGERRFAVATQMTGDVRIAFVSCNGQENGDADREDGDRNLMWQRLLDEHRRQPFSLLLHGGDQIYADEAVESHPELKRWNEAAARERPGIAFTPEMHEAVRRYFFFRYVELARAPSMAGLLSTIPSLMIWDDHDIFDGWGSHPPEIQESPVGRGVFAVAREMFALFQLGASPEALPEICLDPTGVSLGTAARFPGFGVILPDLRSERRPDRVMGAAGWAGFEKALAGVPDGERRLVVSSVPALGPRLGLLERLLDLMPVSHKYEDDLRDQWQSHAHRDEWARFLRAMEGDMLARGAPVSVLSGEIHLATRGEMKLPGGKVLHQLVASGISHPEPGPLFPRGLGLLARLDSSPLPDRSIRMRPLPDQRTCYVAERNFLVLTRTGGDWQAEWELERSGRTRPLAL